MTRITLAVLPTANAARIQEIKLRDRNREETLTEYLASSTTLDLLVGPMSKIKSRCSFPNYLSIQRNGRVNLSTICQCIVTLAQLRDCASSSYNTRTIVDVSFACPTDAMHCYPRSMDTLRARFDGSRGGRMGQSRSRAACFLIMNRLAGSKTRDEGV